VFSSALDLDVEIDTALSQLPAAQGVFAIFAADPAAEPYISQTADLRRRLRRLLGPRDESSKRLNLRQRAARIEWSTTGSQLESLLLLYRAYSDPRRRLKLRPPPFIRYTAENPYPRCYVTTRLSLRATRNFYGPFASRVSAESYLDAVLDLFLFRRCDFNLDPDPAFPGCIYSEMHKCLAPCFKGCTDQRYAEEAAAVRAFLDTCGKSLLESLSIDREVASADLDFEKAAALHQRYEKAKSVAQLAPELARPVSQLSALVLEPAATPDAVNLFLFADGCLHGPVPFSVLGMRHGNEQSTSSSLFVQPIELSPVPLKDPVALPSFSVDSSSDPGPTHTATLDERLSAAINDLFALAQTSAMPKSDLATDHLALLRRWYYRPAGQKTGEIFFRNPALHSELTAPALTASIPTPDAWPLRKILRGISRVFTGQRAAAAAPLQSSIPSRN
jgi:excinuclease ABC subunit C